MKQLYNQKRRFLLVMVAFFSIGFVNAQIQVSGKLTDAKGEALIGATVAEVGTTNGAYTEFDGSFTIKVKSAESVLDFSYVGFQSQKVKVGERRTFNIALKSAAQEMEKVVKIGYASAKPEDVTSAITQVAGKDVGNKPVLGVDQALQGKAAGVQISSNSGSPGAAMNITIRGNGSATGDGRPLYVVDGIAVGNEWKGDPQNVESISILKDASSCAIYGSRGANGVILITTKGGNSVAAGQSDFSNITFEGYRGVQTAWKQVDVASAEEYAQIKNASELAAGNDSAFTQAQIDSFANTNWQDELLRDAIIEKYKVTIDGGSSNSSWSTSAGYLNQDGIVKGTGYEKYDMGFKFMYKLSEKLEFGIGSGFSVTNQDRVYEGNLEQSALGCALIADPTIPVYDSTGNWSNPSKNTYNNPVALVETRTDVTKGFGFGTNAWLSYKIIKNLTFENRSSFSNWSNNRQVYVPYYYINAQAKNLDERLTREIQGGKGWFTSNMLTYSLALNDKVDTNKVKHSFRLLGGQEMLYDFAETFSIEAEGGLLSDDPNMQYFAAGGTKSAKVQDWQLPYEHSMSSQIGRIEYSFKDKYLVNFSQRRDGSSRFGSEMKWGYFPSAGFAWKINKESFIYNNKFLTDSLGITLIKIRGGWGKIGNENIGNYMYTSQMIIDDVRSGYNFNGTRVPGSTQKSVPNEKVHWESATSTNIGAEINFWKNKFMFTYDYYVKNNMENLIRINVPAVVGIDGAGNNPIANLGEIRNAGHEVTLVYRNSYKADSSKYELKYDVNLNLTKNNNEVTYVDSRIPGGYIDRTGSNVSYTAEGYPIASFFGYKIDGVYNSWEEVNQGSQPGSTRPGDYKIVDINGDGEITTDDITYLGSPHPDFTYGISGNASFAGFDLGLSFQGVQGNSIYNATKWYLDGGYLNSNYSTRRLDVWTEENTGSSEPTDPNWFTGKSSTTISSAFIEDGSYFRLKNVSFGYTIPSEIVNKVKLNNVRVYTQIQNAFTFTKYSGFDPEIGTNVELNYQGPEFGIDRGVYPQARSVVFGVNLQF